MAYYLIRKTRNSGDNGQNPQDGPGDPQARYYLLVGSLIEYDEDKAGTDEERRACRQVKRRFREQHDADGTWYKAVKVTSADFSPLNTGVDD